jgi:2-polyprenyl-3-methyl-5-hydroxy-6-metoxy-1,4-benzoquinol methylase
MLKEELIEKNINQKSSESDSFTKERYIQFLNYFSKDHKTVLDFGCNTGRGGIVLKSIDPELILYGSDIIVERLNMIPDGIYHKKINLSQTKLEDSVNAVDVIVSGEVVEHIPIVQLIEYLQTFKTLLNKNGLLMLTTPNPNAYLVRLGRNSVLKEPSHVNIMDIDFLKNLLKKIGFKIEHIKGSGKVSEYLGVNFPLNFYGSYLIVASVKT